MKDYDLVPDRVPRQLRASVAPPPPPVWIRESETIGSRHGCEAAGLPMVSGASRARTGDLLGAIQALSQLSHTPSSGKCSFIGAGLQSRVASPPPPDVRST